MTESIKKIIKIRHCVWLREDLRLEDHEGFKQAQENYSDQISGQDPGQTPGQDPGRTCLALYIFTPETWIGHDRSPQQIYFILENLKLISERLKNLNIPLKILNLKNFKQVPEALLNFCQIYDIENIYAARNYGLDELNRDKHCAELLQKFNIKINFKFYTYKYTISDE